MLTRTGKTKVRSTEELCNDTFTLLCRFGYDRKEAMAIIKRSLDSLSIMPVYEALRAVH